MSDLQPGTELDDTIDRIVMGSETLCGQLIPHYSISIAAAWEMVDKMEDDVTVEIIRMKRCGVVQYHCLMHSGTLGRHHGLAATAPHAICLAALKAVS